jgi:hypothetical protein
MSKVAENVAHVSTMESIGKRWRWPKIKDEIWYSNEELIYKMNVSRTGGGQEMFDVPQLRDLLTQGLYFMFLTVTV